VRARKQSGQAIVELALGMTVLVWLALGTLDFGRVFYTSVGLNNAAREGAQRAALLAPACNLSATQSIVRAEQDGLFPVSIPSSLIGLNCSSSDRRTVTISNYPFTPITPFIAKTLGDGTNLYLSASATMPVLNQ
jgi:hypothetical protein